MISTYLHVLLFHSLCFPHSCALVALIQSNFFNSLTSDQANQNGLPVKTEDTHNKRTIIHCEAKMKNIKINIHIAGFAQS